MRAVTVEGTPMQMSHTARIGAAEARVRPMVVSPSSFARLSAASTLADRPEVERPMATSPGWLRPSSCLTKITL